MGISPVGFYLRRKADGTWVGAVTGRENFQPSQEYWAADRPASSESGIGREPSWVRVMDTLRHGLARDSHRRL
jgi:hypothetical protein